MLEVYPMTPGHEHWQRLIAYAEACSWKAGPELARRMREAKFLPWERVFILLDGGEIAGYCTFSEKDELVEGYDYSPFIGFVFIDEKFRGTGLCRFLIRCVLAYARERTFPKVYVMSGEEGLYEKLGFQKIGSFPTIYGREEQLFCTNT